MYKLLIVDDEASVRSGYANYFPWAEVGFEVTGCASNAQDALHFLSMHHVDAVICDIVMPGMDGVQLAERICEEYPAVQIVMLTAHNDLDQIRRLMQYDVYSYVLKHEKHEVLLRVMRQVREKLDAAGSENEDDIVEKVKRYIDRNLASANLREASEMVHMSQSYLSRIFKERTGINFYKYLIERKIAVAKKELASPSAKVYAVADRLGYNDAKNFNRVFRKEVGMSPKSYQMKFRGQR